MYYQLIYLTLIQLKERYDVENHDGFRQYKMRENTLLEGHPYVGLKVYLQLPMFCHSYNYASLSEASTCYKTMAKDLRSM